MCVSGNSSQYTGLIHAAIPEHTVATGGSIGACGGGDALPTRPVQVQQDVGFKVWLASFYVCPRGGCMHMLFVLLGSLFLSLG